MLSTLKLLPVAIILAGAGYAYHVTVMGQKDLAISELQKNNVILKENNVKLDIAFQQERETRKQSEQNLQTQLKALFGALGEAKISFEHLIIETGNLIFASIKKNFDNKKYLLHASTIKDFYNLQFLGVEMFYEYWNNRIWTCGLSLR